MMEKDQGKFARRAQRILHRDQPTSLADLLEEKARGSGYTESHESVYTENRKSERGDSTVREEFRLPEDLAETLREYAHQQRLKKTAVVIEALQEFFRHRDFSRPKRSV
jgi:stress response protein YsnF